ncbi:hypothetical protein CK203_004812 [Vitis vinifera]|uniref:Uncharacterized protein n=1 Tax=Vitis vinifera TaxID=29760 RepID=A0A438KFN1_VITVI|nr:hypothetical protein CK203_004812 [Vitis vinifera]
MPVTSPGGKCWFGIDLKTFEIIIEDHKGKVHGKICERGPKFSSWIRFGGKGLSLLLEGIESCCGLKERTLSESFGQKVIEFTGACGGWKMFASKLRSVGVAPLQWRGVLLDKQLPSQVSPSSSVGRGSYPLRDCPVPRDAVWLEIEKETLDRNEELLGRCLVGSWVGDADRLPDLVSFGSWAKNSWFLEGNLWLSNVRENLMLLEFEFEDEAKRDARHVWVRILGLPLHLWGRSLFKQFGDSYGRYVAVDENTAERRNLKWARVLVETRGWQHPSSLQVVAGTSCYALQLWWEEEPCLSSVIPASRSDAWKIEDEVVAPSRAMGRVDPQPPSTVILQPEKLPSPILGTGAPITDMTGAAAPSSPARALWRRASIPFPSPR